MPDDSLRCDGGALINDCVPLAAGTDEACDGSDDDCDGLIDEGFVTNWLDAVWAFASMGNGTCTDGLLESNCMPGEPTGMTAIAMGGPRL